MPILPVAIFPMTVHRKKEVILFEQLPTFYTISAKNTSILHKYFKYFKKYISLLHKCVVFGHIACPF
jgi:hypothetical protein